jgi:hypothetical protein
MGNILKIEEIKRANCDFWENYNYTQKFPISLNTGCKCHRFL